MLPSLYQILRQVLISLTLLIVVMIGLASAQQQEEQQQQNQQAQSGSMGGIYRLSFFEFSTLTFREGKDHVFYQMTGFRGFDGGSGARNLSIDWNYEKMLLLGGDEDGHEEIENEVEQVLHSLPPFSLEYIIPLQLGFVDSAVSVMGGYTQTYLTDQSGRNPQKENNSAIYPLIRLRSHYYIFGGSVYLTGVPEPRGTDIFLGIGVMNVQSTLRAGIRREAVYDPAVWTNKFGLGGNGVTELSASQGTVFFQRAGLAVNGENYGLNLDALFTGDTEVIDNPYADGIGPISREDFSEIVYMSTDVPDRVHLRGVLLRAAITYTFY